MLRENVYLWNLDGTMSRKKILFINANSNVIYGPISPLGMGYLIQNLKEDFDYKYIDLGYIYKVEDLQIDFSVYSLILVSLRNFDNGEMDNYYSYFDFYKHLLNYLNEQTDSPIIVGGSALIVDPWKIFTLSGDYFLLGYWENEINQLCKDILEDRDEQLLSYSNLYIKKYDYIRLKSTISEFTVIPDRSLFNKSFLKKGDCGNIEFSRGCAQNCIYCSVPAMFSNIVFKDIKLIDKELSDLKKLGYKDIFIVDNLINQNVQYLKSVCKHIIKYNYSFNFTGQFNPKFYDEELLILMKNAGINTIHMSLCSYNDRVLKSMKKGFTCKEIDNAVKDMLKLGFNISIDFTLGNLNESYEEMMRTLNYANYLKDEGIIVSIYKGLRRFKNTELYRLTPDYCDKVFYYPPISSVEVNINPHEKNKLSFERKNNLYRYLLINFSNYRERNVFFLRKRSEDKKQ